jgi:signal transduction histidine kinase
LAGGGFFWYTIQQQQLLERLDSQLLSTAKNIDFIVEKISKDNSTQQFFCENLSEISAFTATDSDIIIYSPQGKVRCFSEQSNSDNRVAFQKEIQPTSSVSLKNVTGPQGCLRSLTYPIVRKGQATFYLSINNNLTGLKKQLNNFALILLLAGILTLAGFSILQRKLRNRNKISISRLIELMDQTNADIMPAIFEVAETAEPEIQKLARSYNGLMNRLANYLRRARQFSADVTHELRTPLTILRGETELALRNDKDKKQLRQVLESNLEEISRMSYLIEDLLLLSKSDLGEIPFKIEPLHLEELISELHHQAQLLATTKNIKVELHCPQKQIILHADSLRLRQVFLNLLTNAIKYTHDGGTVIIDLELNDENVATTITDTGIGIDNEHLKWIFDRFYRVNKTSNCNDGGSGLGLAIVKWIVDTHGGSIKVSSIPGHGGKFTVIFPRPQNMLESESAAEQQKS